MLLNKKDQEFVKNIFLKKLRSNIRILVFTSDKHCQYCKQTLQIADELASLSKKIYIKNYDIDSEYQLALDLGVDKVPAIVFQQKQEDWKDYGIRLFGIPSGYEFNTLIEDIVMISTGDSGLSKKTKETLRKIKKPVHFQVFITPTCPYCPKSVQLAHQIAMENPFISADMVEATTFTPLAIKYNVRGVPKIVINEKTKKGWKHPLSYRSNYHTHPVLFFKSHGGKRIKCA